MNSSLPIKNLIALPQPLARDIADFRFTNRINTESAAMRALLRAGLKASAESPPQRTKQSKES